MDPQEETAKPEVAAPEARRRVTKVGVVTSNKMTKTVTVTVDTTKSHGVYGRTVRSRSKFLAHDPLGKCRLGDRVVIEESRPLSRRKRWRVVSVVEQAAGAATASGAGGREP